MNSRARTPVVEFDPHDPNQTLVWPEQYAELHRRGMTVAWSPAHGGFWHLIAHADVKRASEDWATFSSYNDVEHGGARGGGILIPPLPWRLTLNEIDPPLHKQLRGLEQAFFLPKSLQALQEHVEHFAQSAVTELVERGDFDLVYDFALRITSQTVMRIVGLNPSDWKHVAMPTHKSALIPTDSPDYPHAGMERLREMIRELVQERRVRPRDDMASMLARATIDGEPLSDEQAGGMLHTLIAGGFDTTSSAILHALYWLQDKESTRRELLSDVRARDNAIDEFLRYFSPSQAQARTVTREVEIGGRRLQAGDRVLLSWVGANHDPRVFERPTEIWLQRPNARAHLAFGGGVHRCLGSLVARHELRAMLRAFLETARRYEIDRERSTKMPTIGVVHMWQTMPVSVH